MDTGRWSSSLCGAVALSTCLSVGVGITTPASGGTEELVPILAADALGEPGWRGGDCDAVDVSHVSPKSPGSGGGRWVSCSLSDEGCCVSQALTRA